MAVLPAIFLALAFLARSAAPAADRATNLVSKTTLANGLRVVIVRNTLAPVVATDLVYVVGSRDDPADVPGMAHAQEHMMFRGTKNLSTSELGTLATALGGDFNAETSETLTQFEFTVPATDLDAILRVESDRMRDILDSQAQWENERGAIEQEVLRDETAPGADLFSDARAIAFAGSAYAHDGVGTRTAFDNLRGERLKAFYDRWYAPNNAVLVIAGDVEPKAALADVRARFASIPRKLVPAHLIARFRPLERTVIRRSSSLVYPLAVVGYRLPGVDDPDFLPSYLLQILLDSPRGPIHSLVDSGEALEAGWLALPYFPEAQLGFATAALQPGADPFAMTHRLEGILHDYAASGVPPELFETTRRHAISDQELSRNSIAALANDWATTVALDGEPSIAREQQLLANVTLADVDRVAKKYLDSQHAIVGALTPAANASQAAPPITPQQGHEKPLAPQQPVTHLPPWAAELVKSVTVPQPRTVPTESRLPNGLTLIVVPETISDSIFVYGDVRTNSYEEEPEGREGIANVLATLFEYGTEKHDRTAFARAQDELDSQISAGTRFGLQTTPRSFEPAVALLAENELTPRFDEETVAAARARTAQELQTMLGGTSAVALRETAQKLLPAGDPELREATPEGIASLAASDVRAYYARIFRPDLATIVVIGNISVEAARAAIEHTFGAWHAEGEPPRLDLPPVPLNAAADVKVSPPGALQADVNLEQMLLLRRSDPQFHALELGNAILGGGSTGPEQSRLFRDIRQNAGLAYDIGSQLSADRYRTRLRVSFTSLPANAARITALIDAEIERMRNGPVAAFELALAKASIVRRSIVEEGSVDAIGARLLDAASEQRPLDQDRADDASYLATTAEAIRSAFAAYVHPDHFVRVTIGP